MKSLALHIYNQNNLKNTNISFCIPMQKKIIKQMISYFQLDHLNGDLKSFGEKLKFIKTIPHPFKNKKPLHNYK